MAAAPALNCVVTLPPNALTAKGLSTPWTVTGCDQTANPTFAECTVVDPATGALGVYSPLLVNQGAVAGKDFIAPVVPQLPANAVVGCWFGTNGATTALTDANNGADVKAANCIGIQGQTTFGQFAACNAQNFFATANTKAQIPPLNTGKNGQPCYTTRSFEVIDMDPSDNVVTTYSQAGKVLAQKTAANVAQLQKMTGTAPTDVTNGSDNLLLDGALRPALGCADFTAANLADPTGPQVGSLALNELQASALQTKNPALVPPTDPFVLDANGTPNLAKQNMYRVAVNQPPATGTPAETMAFCQNMLSVTAPSYITTSQFLLGQNTPDPANGIDLFTFMGQRFQASWAGLTCNTLIPLTDTNGNPVQSPVIATRNAQGVATSVTFTTAALVAMVNAQAAAAKNPAPAPAPQPQPATGNTNTVGMNTNTGNTGMNTNTGNTGMNTNTGNTGMNTNTGNKGMNTNTGTTIVIGPNGQIQTVTNGINGQTTNGQTTNGQTTNGQTTNGQTTNGQTTNGQTTNGQNQGNTVQTQQNTNQPQPKTPCNQNAQYSCSVVKGASVVVLCAAGQWVLIGSCAAQGGSCQMMGANPMCVGAGVGQQTQKNGNGNAQQTTNGQQTQQGTANGGQQAQQGTANGQQTQQSAATGQQGQQGTGNGQQAQQGATIANPAKSANPAAPASPAAPAVPAPTVQAPAVPAPAVAKTNAATAANAKTAVGTKKSIKAAKAAAQQAQGN